MLRGAAIAVIACGACTTVQNEPLADPAKQLDETVFRCSVEPILARQCSYNACHGIAGQPGSALRVYSPGKLRATKPADIDAAIAPLTDDEQHANFESAAGFATAAIGDNFLLRKPLASAAGGFEHAGGAIFPTVTDPQYQAIAAWLLGKGHCP